MQGDDTGVRGECRRRSLRVAVGCGGGLGLGLVAGFRVPPDGNVHLVACAGSCRRGASETHPMTLKLVRFVNYACMSLSSERDIIGDNTVTVGSGGLVTILVPVGGGRRW